jgi:lysophospholipase L1-like esterase
MFKSLCVASMVAAASAADIVVFGDSWGTFGRNQFRDRAAQDGLTVDNRAIGGTTANYWSRDVNKNKLRDAVRENPDAKFVWLTIGGNDAIPKMAARVPREEIIQQVVNDTLTFIDPMLNEFPNVAIVGFGYEQLFWNTRSCTSLAQQIFWECPGNPVQPACANEIQMSLQDAVERTQAARPGRYFAVNLYGAMQVDAGVAGASVGSPNVNQYSSSVYQNDCIHLNSAGYTVVFDALWDEFFSKRL